MVSTRRKRRNTDEPGDPLLDAAHAAAALEKAEATRLRKAKKKRQEAFLRNHPPWEMLPIEAVTNILLYVNDARIIQALSMTAKWFRHAITPQVIIRAAVFGGNSQRSNMKNLFHDLQLGSIHTSSPFRLLRLACAKVCERGELCYGYDNLIRKQPKRLNQAGCLGLAICATCWSTLSTQPYGRNRWKVEALTFVPACVWIVP